MQTKLANAIICTAVFFCLITGAKAAAFCVFNHSDKKIQVIQESGGSDCWGFCPWQADIASGDKSCCNWQDSKCNKEGEKDSIVTFSVPALYEDNAYYCRSVKVKAGGWLSIHGSGQNITCVAHY